MIELRWLKKKDVTEIRNTPHGASPKCEITIKGETVLQYRECGAEANMHVDGTVTSWSEWQTVLPVVEEE